MALQQWIVLFFRDVAGYICKQCAMVILVIMTQQDIPAPVQNFTLRLNVIVQIMQHIQILNTSGPYNFALLS